jgi:hypothetical protein
VQQSRQRCLGALGWGFRPRPAPVPGSIAGTATVTVAGGSTDGVVAGDGSMAVVAGEDGSTVGAMAAAVPGSIAGK